MLSSWRLSSGTPTQQKRPSGDHNSKTKADYWPHLSDAKLAFKHGVLSGAAGASAMLIQVACLMPLDTTITVQYRYGQSMFSTFRSLMAAGGLARFYSGWRAAVLQGPLARFGDTSTNATVLYFLDSADGTKSMPTLIKTTAASAMAACWRVTLMPIDVCKTVYQVYGSSAFSKLVLRARTYGVGGFYFGSAAAFASAFAGHLPWYATFNELDRTLRPGISPMERLVRHAVLGFSASFVSDCVTNSLRVIKAIRQAEGLSYLDSVRSVVKTDGLFGLATRGLQTRLLLNGLQGVFFTIVWKSLEQAYSHESKHARSPS